MSSRDNPFRDIERLFEEMNEGLRAFEAGEDVPADLLETEEGYVAVFDLPGYERDAVDVRLADRRLTVSAERDTGREGEYVRQERSGGSVSRTLDLPSAVAAGETSATYESGVLTVRLPRRASGDGESIPIE